MPTFMVREQILREHRVVAEDAYEARLFVEAGLGSRGTETDWKVVSVTPADPLPSLVQLLALEAISDPDDEGDY